MHTHVQQRYHHVHAREEALDCGCSIWTSVSSVRVFWSTESAVRITLPMNSAATELPIRSGHPGRLSHKAHSPSGRSQDAQALGLGHAEHLVPWFRKPRRCRGSLRPAHWCPGPNGGGDQRSNIHIASRDHAIKGRFHTLILLRLIRRSRLARFALMVLFRNLHIGGRNLVVRFLCISLLAGKNTTGTRTRERSRVSVARFKLGFYLPECRLALQKSGPGWSPADRGRGHQSKPASALCAHDRQYQLYAIGHSRRHGRISRPLQWG